MGSIFKNAFLKKIGELPVSSKDSNRHMNTEPVISTPRHRGKGWTGVNRLSQNLVAKSHIINPNTVRELDRLKKRDSGMFPLSSPLDVNKIVKQFNLQNLDAQHPKTLGNTGIVIFFNPGMNCFCLKK